MKIRIIAVWLVSACFAFGQQITPNIGLVIQTPPQMPNNWSAIVNYDLVKIDTAFAGVGSQFKGTWNSGTTYAAGNVVQYIGQLYISIQSSNLDQNPVSQTAYWTQISITYPSAGLAASTGSAWRAPVFGDVVSLWTSCTSGYLKFDGTCSTPSGGGSPGGTRGSIQYYCLITGTFCGDLATTDGSGNILTPGSYNTSGSTQGLMALGVGSGTLPPIRPTYFVAHVGPTSGTPQYGLQDCNSAPTGNSVQEYGATSSVGGIQQSPCTWLLVSSLGNATQVNGASVPASQACLGSNSSSQLIAGSCGGGSGGYQPTILALPPSLSVFTLQDPGSLTTTSTLAGLFPTATMNVGTAGNQYLLSKTAAYSTPYSVSMCFITDADYLAGNTYLTGLAFTDGTKILAFNAAYVGPWQLRVDGAPSASNWGAATNYLNQQIPSSTWPYQAYTDGISAIPDPRVSPLCLRIRDDGTTLYFDMSSNGWFWYNAYSQAVGTFLTPTGYGMWGIANVSSGQPMRTSMVGFQETNSAAF